MTKIKIFLLHIFAFAMVFTFGLQALAQAAEATDGELENALNSIIEAIKMVNTGGVGAMGAVIMAVVMLLRTRFVSSILIAISSRMAAPVPAPVEHEPQPDELSQQGYTTMETLPVPAPAPKVSNGTVRAATVLLGAGAGIAQSMATGMPLKEAAISGLFSSAVASGLWELAVKPILKKISK